MIVRSLFSAKQVGILYHYTGFYYLSGILESGYIQGNDSRRMYHPMDRAYPVNKYRFISTTRDKNFHKTYRGGIPINCRLVLDGDKISERYKVVPYDYFWDNYDPDEMYDTDPRIYTSVGRNNPERLGPRLEFYESEEMILLPVGNNLPVFNYLIRVDFVRSSIPHLGDRTKEDILRILRERKILFRVIT